MHIEIKYSIILELLWILHDHTVEEDITAAYEANDKDPFIIPGYLSSLFSSRTLGQSLKQDKDMVSCWLSSCCNLTTVSASSSLGAVKIIFYYYLCRLSSFREAVETQNEEMYWWQNLPGAFSPQPRHSRHLPRIIYAWKQQLNYYGIE